MEAVGGAAAGSTTGIVRFTGQTAEGLVKLRSLITGVKDSPTPKSVRILFESAARLRATLDDVEALPKLLQVIGAPSRLTLQLPASSGAPALFSSSNAVLSLDSTVAGAAVAPSGASIGGGSFLDDTLSSISALEGHLQACAVEVRLIVDGLKSQVVDENNSFRQSWKQIQASLDGTFEEFARTLIAQNQGLQQVLRKLGRQLGRSSPDKLEAITEKVEDGSGNLKEDVGSPSSNTEVAAEEISSTRSEAADSAGATKATLTVGKQSLNNGENCGGVNGNSRQQQQRRGAGYHYTCEAISGIDGAVEERGDGAIGCLYCGRCFVHDDETTIHRFGFHLVRAHGFGMCNLNCVFDTRTELLRHLRSFHTWSRGDGGDEYEEEELALVLEKKFRAPRRSESRCSRLLDLEDGDVQPPRGLRQEGEETGLLNLLVLNEILRVAQLDVKMDAPRPPVATSDEGETKLAHELCMALANLDKLSNEMRAKTAATAITPTANGTTGDGRKTTAKVGLLGAEGLDTRLDLDELVYHAACVQQELAVSSGGEDVLRHEALYSADQYRIDDLVCMYFPPRASPDRHRAWYVRPANVGPGAPASAVAAVYDAIERLGLMRLESAGPLRSFRDAVRLLGRAHMEETGAKNYMAAMPQLLLASKVLLRQDIQPPGANSHTAVWNGATRATRMGPMRSNTMPLLYRPFQSQAHQSQKQQQQQQDPVEENKKLKSKNLARLVKQQQQDAHRLADTTRERRLRWITDESLDWWFLSMLERSASFRRLVRSGKAFPDAPTKESDKKHMSKPGAAGSTANAEACKTKLAPYAWAAALLSSAGIPPNASGLSRRVNMSRAGASGSGSAAGSNGHVPRVTANTKGSASALSLARAEHGSESERSTGTSRPQPQQQQKLAQQLMQKPKQQAQLPLRQKQEPEQQTTKGKGKEREQISGRRPQRAISDAPTVNGKRVNGKIADDGQHSADEGSWESSSSG